MQFNVRGTEPQSFCLPREQPHTERDR
jgi:hypothetical protein